MSVKHVIYTRCDYISRAETSRRLRLSERFTIPAMASQKNILSQPKWVWLCKPDDIDQIRRAVRSAGYAGELAFNERGANEQIQTTLDSDDWVASDWLCDIQSRYSSGRTFIRYYHPWRYEMQTGQWYKPRRIASWTSMFYSVYNPTVACRVYFRRHTQIVSTKEVSVEPVKQEGFCALVIHDHNKCTTIKRGDIPIPTPPTFLDSGRTR